MRRETRAGQAKPEDSLVRGASPFRARLRGHVGTGRHPTGLAELQGLEEMQSLLRELDTRRARSDVLYAGSAMRTRVQAALRALSVVDCQATH